MLPERALRGNYVCVCLFTYVYGLCVSILRHENARRCKCESYFISYDEPSNKQIPFTLVEFFLFLLFIDRLTLSNILKITSS